MFLTSIKHSFDLQDPLLPTHSLQARPSRMQQYWHHLFESGEEAPRSPQFAESVLSATQSFKVEAVVILGPLRCTLRPLDRN